MGGLNVHADDESSVSQSHKKKWFKSPKLILGLAVLVAIPIIGTTFAANVGINTDTGSKVIFGQGQASALACDDQVVITPYAKFLDHYWYLDKVEISDVSADCQGKSLTLGAYDNTGNTIPGSPTTFVVGSEALNYTPSTWLPTGNNPSQNSPTIITLTYPEVQLYSSNPDYPYNSNNINGFTLQEQN